MSERVDPIVNDLNRPFWAAASEGRLMLPHCVATGAAFWPPSAISPFASGREATWGEVEPEGLVLAIVVYRRTFQKAFADLLPYGIAMVALDCGPRLQVHVEHPDDPGAPVAGSRVRLEFSALLADGPRLLVARPASLRRPPGRPVTR